MSVLVLAEALAITQLKLTETLGKNCAIRVHRALNDGLIDTILQVDAYKFRQELRYRREEIIQHSLAPGFILITAECDAEPLGIVYGYKEPDGEFFLDTLASMVEGRGIGHMLATLIITHAENTGHKHVTLYTEEQDEKGRLLRRFYQKMGFTYLGTEPEKGDVMVMKLTPEDTTSLFSRYVETLENPPIATPPTLNKNIPQPSQPILCNS
jgi:ribosomal protein S18 acetylase RimI-like enzyme